MILCKSNQLILQSQLLGQAKQKIKIPSMK